MASTHCDRCGATVLDEGELTEERLPLGRTKRLCHRCHRRFYRRFWLVLGLLVLGFGLWGAVGGAHRDQRLLDVPLVWLALFLMFHDSWCLLPPVRR